MPIVKIHVVKLSSSNAALSSPRGLTQGGTFFLSDVPSELKTMYCGDPLSNHAASISHSGENSTPSALAEDQSPSAVLPEALPQIPQIP